MENEKPKRIRNRTEYMKQYYQNNADKIKENGKASFVCETCNCKVTTCQRKRHYQSKKHIYNDIVKNDMML